jgi:hypothetical protein
LKAEREEKQKFIKHIEESCRTAVSKEQTRGMVLQEGMKIAMELTKQTGEEAGFTYNPQTKKVTSRIVVGTHRCVVPPLEEFHPKAFFHTHPKLYHDKQCEISIVDLFSIIPNGATELKVGCPTNNEVVTLTFEPSALTKLIIELTKIETRKDECLPITEDALASICDELIQEFPDLEEKIEVIRKKHLLGKEKLPSLLRENIMNDLAVFEERLINRIPKTREKLTI